MRKQGKLLSIIMPIVVFSLMITFICLILNSKATPPNAKVTSKEDVSKSIEDEEQSEEMAKFILDKETTGKSLLDMEPEECYDTLIELGVDIVIHKDCEYLQKLVGVLIEDTRRYEMYNFSGSELEMLEIRAAVFAYEGIEDPISEDVINEYKIKLRKMSGLE